ncbi:MAG: hypothetical protein A2931_03665 [Candidatus Niyogibacteria bacterium RIFCSPLOWO2_01_FULL_45_48]|uniref:Hydrolase TatD n=2 Tax=Candidatus Niyogiibacteriota TaxID=1817912 RepID=A0A1G2EXR5_9BACT|nr:MAG: hypothetical protein A2835_02275 [Candidatus Niyogibacteria bacterium RIFCSPHIGHO2_01_FULL_45_28]OGZ30180.1 MAG: hypothetical protein A3J00_00740 [Candidatus Niyogibacteria bacterium RIFCSPLOWO2_02_FULL_45_13]OGZ30926.1 MAG: hypothetical protein A2931_03665 [Candidatus Niyogibacteria bacterium RIFCSPLOWO2_01_FULL_45_48]
MLIDSHAHLQFKAFDADRDEVIKRTLEGGVFCINVGTQKDTSRAAVELAEKHEGFWAAVGLHPIHTEESFHDEQEISGSGVFKSREEVFDSDFYEKLAKHPKVVAIGECGFDYYRAMPDSRKKQEDAFCSQVRLAKKIGKPIMLHCRPSQNPDKSYSDDAYLDMFRVLKEEGGNSVGGNVHFFVGSTDIAKKFLEIGFSFSFSGVITITNMYDEVVKFLPLDKILIETDSPYAAPIPYRGKRNEPPYVEEVAKRLAELHGKSFEEIAELTTQNAKKVFNLKF